MSRSVKKVMFASPHPYGVVMGCRNNSQKTTLLGIERNVQICTGMSCLRGGDLIVQIWTAY